MTHSQQCLLLSVKRNMPCQSWKCQAAMHALFQDPANRGEVGQAIRQVNLTASGRCEGLGEGIQRAFRSIPAHRRVCALRNHRDGTVGERARLCVRSSLHYLPCTKDSQHPTLSEACFNNACSSQIAANIRDDARTLFTFISVGDPTDNSDAFFTLPNLEM